ncbi:MAG: response regulator [Deltaproteobacteria bacterium]|nr:response regulator [Deltaproteobacteria bacterium]
MEKDILDLKRILIVDDEPDVLDTLEDLLDMCDVVKAATFEDAKEHLETQYFDIAILDIMGVDGYKLLEIANRKKVLGVMLTAHALSPDHTKRSYQRGAALYVPKDKITEIATFLQDVLEARERGKTTWWRWFDRFGAYFDRKFKAGWKDKDGDFWGNLPLR